MGATDLQAAGVTALRLPRSFREQHRHVAHQALRATYKRPQNLMRPGFRQQSIDSGMSECTPDIALFHIALKPG